MLDIAFRRFGFAPRAAQWTKWHWKRFFSEHIGFPLSIIITLFRMYSYIVWFKVSVCVRTCSPADVLSDRNKRKKHFRTLRRTNKKEFVVLVKARRRPQSTVSYV